jgi:hypothetical protein
LIITHWPHGSLHLSPYRVGGVHSIFLDPVQEFDALQGSGQKGRT